MLSVVFLCHSMAGQNNPGGGGGDKQLVKVDTAGASLLQDSRGMYT